MLKHKKIALTRLGQIGIILAFICHSTAMLHGQTAITTLNTSNAAATSSLTLVTAPSDTDNVDTGTSDNNALSLSTAVGIGNSDVATLNTQFAGDIPEIIVFADDLDSEERNRVDSYLAIKYGITLVGADDVGTGSVDEQDYRKSDGTSIWDYSVRTSTYYNDIAGIGRDDTGCYEQKQSSSINTDGIVTMGLGTIATDNASNPNSFATDGSFLVWGNDNDFADQANANTADLPASVTERMERIWNVQETGTVAATTISFDLTGLGYSSTVSDFSLIVSGSATMAGGTLYTAASLVGNILTFNNIDLTDGQFFTIGTARDVCGPGGVSAGLILSLRGEAGTTGTTVVTAWEDQSLNTHSVTATTGPELISNGINFNPSLQFNGTDETMAITAGIIGTSTPTDLIIFAVTEVGTVQNSELFYEDLSSGEVFSAQVPWGDANVSYDYPNATGGVGRVSGAWGASTGDAHLWTLFSSTSSFSTASGNINKGIFRDGNLIFSNTSSQSGTGNNSDFNIASNGTSNFYGADISEILIYNVAPTTQELEQIQTYLAVKYGIFKNSADNGGTGGVDERDYFRSDAVVIWDYSNNTAYHQDVAGIGRDDDSCLNQKQSSNEASDDILTVGLETIAADNASNVNSFLADGDFLVWGNDGGATLQANVNTADVPGIVEERMTRVWVDETGTVGDTEISFDLTGLGYTSNPDDFQLIISATSTMASGQTFGGGTFNGSILTFTGVDFADGDYFTLGTSLLVCGPGGVFTNLELWLRADIGTSTTINGANLTGASAWSDQSVNANNGAESNLAGGTPVEPTYQTNEINFNPVVAFIDPNSSNASYIETSSNTVSGDLTLISVFETGQNQGTLDDFVDTPALIGANATGTADYGLGMYQGQLIFNANTTDVFDATTASTYNNNEPHIGLATRTLSSGAVEIFVGGETDATGTGVAGSTALSDPTSFGIGNHSEGTVPAQFNGKIGESIVFSSVLTGEEQSRVETYLAIKYGLTLSADRNGATPNELISGIIREGDYVAGDGGIVWDYANQDPTYFNDLFGIARDDVSCFEQIKTKSENNDAMVTFDYTNTGFSTNDSWLISGNDNAPVEAINNSERPITINSRLNREWRVQETGTVGQIELTYDLASITGTPTGDNNLNLVRLMVDDDGDFRTGVTLIAPSSIDGGAKTVTFLVDFTDGQYYTLGSTEVDALPITLIAFDTRVTNDNTVDITWATAQEVNNSFYTVERSTDGVLFETVGFKEGAGNSNAIIDYTFIDKEPLDGISYYRLKQTDFNGQFEYSELSRVYIDLAEKVTHKVIPNPVNRGDVFKVNYPVTEIQDVHVMLASVNGGSSINTIVMIKPEDEYIEVSTDKLSRGLYFIRIVNKQLKQVTLKFIVR